jgi:[ribosomal protein S18]-alanine N-acetyltransferase
VSADPNFKPGYVLRYMRLEDIPQVVEIDKLSFPMPWSPRSYSFEISDNNAGHMIVLEIPTTASTDRGLMGVLHRLRGQPTVPTTITGYGGFWLIEGEAHISTIAVHPAYRSHGLGELLLAGMLERGMALKAEYAVLEVRVSNESAINLYRKYEFEIVGQRKNYYRDNNEDAYLMHLAPMDDAYKVRFAERLNKLRERVFCTNLLSQADNESSRVDTNRR